MDNKGIIIKCGNCGFLRHIDLERTPEEIESDVNDMIQDGWRYTKKWKGYVCPKCRKEGVDPLYQAFYGKVRTETKVESYKQLLIDVARQLEALKDIEWRYKHEYGNQR